MTYSLAGKSVFIIEDDPYLLSKLCAELKEVGFANILNNCNCKESAIAELKAYPKDWDYLVVDVRIPNTEAQLKENYELLEDLLEKQKQLLKDDNDIIILEIDAIKDKMRQNVNQKAGIELINTWYSEIINKEDVDTNVIYLSSLIEAKKEGLKTYVDGKVKWLTKPVIPNDIIQIMINF